MGTGTFRFFKEPFCRAYNKRVIKGFAQFSFHNFVIKQVQMADKEKPFAFVVDICVMSETTFLRGMSARKALFNIFGKSTCSLPGLDG